MSAMASSDPFRLDGEVALITGGATGLGFGMAECFVRAGANVILLGRREAVLRDAAGRLGDAARFVAADVTDDAAKLQAALAPLGPISILVNNAGNHLKKPATETSDAEFLSIIDTHVLASFRLTRTVAPPMLAAGRGSMLFITSMSALMGIPSIVAYSTAKAAYVGMVRALASEFSPRGVRVNAIAPGWIESPMLRQALDNDPPRKQKIVSRTPMGKFGEPADIGNAAVYLCSPAAKFVTGVVLPIDGGASIGF
jgi:NAD(P)-dependent dehydrogenase (short-subunit alcohol dehydrogenase family)